MPSIKDAVERVRETMAGAALRSGRDPADIRLVAVTKQVDDERISEALEAGVRIIGENYAQEAQRTFALLKDRDIEWHFIGRLQRNKAKYTVRFMDMIHSVDRIEVAREIDRRAEGVGRVMNILVAVNLAGEQSKSGVAGEETPELVRRLSVLKNLSIRGLMTMPPWSADPEAARPFFRSLRELRDRIDDEGIPGVSMKELSMGMSGDYAVAIEEGATMVRIGRAIFGERT
ncbi:MAG: YggS family pyridoxal phosphate-dependent enzyme [Syntrophales bacterium]|jgi:pyridoxal phosphate enzyme (YggS family)|nr:YggS family pyridoxal phosphate-dependent enzyme [Syntrophales bacterium]MCK9528893.1 YggS family pyridoxal phosphate-dependent enzyme [Syntrophales bacterium]MDX9922943.1 YggS family pyridoxal phosphate-dependent enzyme [Syntrophales bacterium]